MQDSPARILKGRQSLRNAFLPARREGVADYAAIETGLLCFGSQAGTQSTEPHLPGQDFCVLMKCCAFTVPSQAGEILSVCKRPTSKPGSWIVEHLRSHYRSEQTSHTSHQGSPARENRRWLLAWEGQGSSASPTRFLHFPENL